MSEDKNIKFQLRWLALPYLASLVYVLSNISQYFPILNLVGLVKGLLLTLGITTALFIILEFIIKNSVRTAIILTLVLIPVYFAFDVQFWSSMFGLSGIIPLLLVLIVIVYAVIRVLIRKRDLTPIYRLTGAVIILMLLHQALYTLFTFSNFSQERSNFLQADVQVSTSTRMTYALDSLPDIYFIMLDAHTSYSSLSKYWNYHNTDFIDSLKAQNFLVADQARSNYDKTPFSLSSTWNMSPLKKKDIHIKNAFPYLMSITNTTRTNPVYRAFNDLGYQFCNLSIFNIGNNKSYYNYGLQTEIQSFSQLLWKRTLFGMVMDYGVKRSSKSQFKFRKLTKTHGHIPESHESIIDSLQLLAASTGAKPNFVYGHLMLPHHPYYVDKLGSTLNEMGEVFPDDISEKKKRYLDQLIYIDNELEKLVDAILERKNRPAVIIIQGDHGFRELEDPQQNAEERQSILYAIKVPGNNYNGLSSNVTSMYTFRWLLEEHFGLRIYAD